MSQPFAGNSRRDEPFSADFRLPTSTREREGNGGVARIGNLDTRRDQRLAELPHGLFAGSMQLNASQADCADGKSRSGVLRLLDRVLERGRSAAQRHERPGALAEAFAAVPIAFSLPPSIGFRVVVHGTQRELKAGLREEIYRIGCEAIVNAFRHSGASEIEMQVEYRPAELRIAVRDNGRGINPQELRWGLHEQTGLQAMRGRAERIGARLRLLSRVALGTEVELCVPGRIAFDQNSVRVAC